MLAIPNLSTINSKAENTSKEDLINVMVDPQIVAIRQNMIIQTAFIEMIFLSTD